MTFLKRQAFFFCVICLSLTIAELAVDADTGEESLKVELEQLKSRVSLLESNVEEKIRELKNQDDNIKQMDDIIQEKSTIIASLRNDIAVHDKGLSDANGQVDKAHTQIKELETQVASLRKQKEKLDRKRDALESRAIAAEEKVSELNSKLEGLKRVSDEQKTRIRKMERALQVAEEEITKAKLRETTVYKELREIKKSWVPHWLSVHLLHCQSFILTQWKEGGRPLLDATFQKALQKKAKVEKWAEPHVGTVKTKWIPVMKDQYLSVVSLIGPQVKLLTSKSFETFNGLKKSIGPHVVELKDKMDPHFQEMKKFTKPYFDQVAALSKPHVDTARVFLKPYTKRISRTYRKFKKAFTSYHLQLQNAVRENLRNFELTESLATKEIVWFVASALMALPVILVFKLVSPMFRKKPRRRPRNSHTSHTRRKARRVHAEN